MKYAQYVTIVFVLLAGIVSSGPAFGQIAGEQGGTEIRGPLPTGFSYQGRLQQSGNPVNGACDLQFSLFNALSGGSEIGATQTVGNVTVSQGLFTVTVNGGNEFGPAAFSGEARWLHIAVRCPAGTGSYTTLTPRHPLTATPYALYATSAPWAGLTNVPDGFADGIDNDTLATLSCGVNQITKWNGSAWICAADSDTTYSSGTGLYLSGSAFTILPAYRLPQSCPINRIAKWNGSAWICADDNDTTYSAGTGLNLSGSVFSIVPAYRLPQSCGVNHVAKWTGTAWTCAADNDTLYSAGTGLTLSGNQFGVNFAGSGSNNTVSRSDHQHFGQSWTGSSALGLQVLNTLSSGTAYGLFGSASSASGARGVYGLATSTSGLNYGVQGHTYSNNGIGVFGMADNTSGINHGVYGVTFSGSGHGVYGINPSGSGPALGVYGESGSISGTGVRGSTTATSGINHGVWGSSTSTGGYGVVGEVTASSGPTYGVLGYTYSTGGTGVYGHANANSGAARGILGSSNSTSGEGVRGVTQSSSGTTRGVIGISNSTSGFGVYGWAAASSGSPVAVWGETSASSGFAGYFVGKTHVQGTLSKSAGSFKIDHPLDPANKYLYHSFVESPDMKNIYDGVATLDHEGAVWVELSDWFEALNKEFRYQLTAIGAPMPGLYIAHTIEDNRFRIAGGVPGLQVSWQVTGIRQDPYADAHRIPVEEEKPENERGTYLYPELYGQPEELGLDYARRGHVSID
jgi:hypothetical protein